MSGLNKLAYRGFEEADKQADKDSLIEQGFTVVEEDKDNPFTSSQGRAAPPRSAPGRNSEIFTDTSGTRNYKALYRIAHDFHKRHAPPTLENGYWDKTAEDMDRIARTHNNDPFLIDLLTAIYEELEREYHLLGSSASATESRR